MSKNAGSHQDSNYDVDTSLPSMDLITFCTQLLHHSQWKSRRLFLAGSYIEIPDFWSIGKDFDVQIKELDLDEMIYYNFHYAFDQSVTIPETYTGDIVRIHTDDVHIGYARLIRENNCKELLTSEIHQLKQGDQRHGPAIMTDIKTIISRKNYSLGSSSVNQQEFEQFNISYRDRVHAVHSPHWPTVATEWVLRKRPSQVKTFGFPLKSIVKEIVRYGCDFVQVSHNKLNDCDWRFSFSHAELCIIKTWEVSRKIVYSVLRTLNKRIENSKLCSYYYKTLMFWVWEEKPLKSWNYHLLVDSVFELLVLMMQCVKSKFCANYFIPGNNMLDHLVEVDLSYEMNSLWKTLQSRELILNIINACQPRAEVLINFAVTKLEIELPSWIYRAFVLYERMENNFDNYKDLFNSNLPACIQKALSSELGDIYKGIFLQRESVQSCNTSDGESYLLKSEKHLLMAVNLYKSNERVVINNSSQEFREILVGNFMSCDADGFCPLNGDAQNFINSPDESKTSIVKNKEKLLAENDFSERKQANRNVKIVVHKVTKLKTDIFDKVEYHKELPGRSPTVNISWFVAKAYLANLYYTSKCDSSLTIKTCDDIIDVYRQSRINLELAERTFPVVLSTQWTNIYDTNIQELLGFYSLCSYVLNPRNRSVYLSVCPVQFALYLKASAGQYHTSPQWTVREGAYGELAKNCRDYNEHADVCHCDENVNNGQLAVSKALSNRNRKAMNKNKAVFYVIMKLLAKIKNTEMQY